jgi:hypothetical protein
MRHRLTGTTARTLGGGITLAPGELVTLTSEEAAHPDTAWLLTEGLLVEDADEAPEAVEEPEAPAPKRQQSKAAAKAAGKAGAGDTATTDEDEATPELPAGDDDTNGGTDR